MTILARPNNKQAKQKWSYKHPRVLRGWQFLKNSGVPAKDTIQVLQVAGGSYDFKKVRRALNGGRLFLPAVALLPRLL